MQFDAQWLLLALAPVFLACIGWQAWHLSRTRPRTASNATPDSARYAWPDTLCNAALALMRQGADKLAWLVAVPVYAYVYRHFRLVSWQPGLVAWFALFIAQDLLYYVFHRASHRVRWLRAAHVIHHSSERLNLATAFRQSLMYPKLGWLEYVFNTPSMHRVHHARNARYIDRIYAGVLAIRDSLFGSYVDEDAHDAPGLASVAAPATPAGTRYGVPENNTEGEFGSRNS